MHFLVINYPEVGIILFSCDFGVGIKPITPSSVFNLFAATSLFKMLLKYRPEDKAAKKERLLKRAQSEAEGKTTEVKKPIVVKYGLNHVTYLIEQVT